MSLKEKTNMNQMKLLILVLILFLFSKPASSQNIEAQVDKLYQVNENEPGFSVAVFKGNEILFEKTYGNANLDYTIPITHQTVFDIASISKQFTAAAILLLEHEGKLSIKDPVYKYIDNLPRYKKGNPTIEHLLNQTSGIKEVDHYWGVLDLHKYDLKTESQMVNIITKVQELRFTPGEYFYYTNANYILLAAVVRNITGQSLGDYAQENIFEPLGMTHTLIRDNTYEIVKNRAIGYAENEDGTFSKQHTHSFVLAGDGQVLTRPRDMFKWHLNLKNAVIGTSQIWQKMHTKATLNDGTVLNFGLGVEFETHNGYNAHGFDGMWTGGFVSKYLYFPKLDLAFFTTQNKFDWGFREQFFQFVDFYIPTTNSKNNPLTYPEVKLPTSELKKYEGKYLYYYNDDDRKANSVKLKNNTLTVFTLDGDTIGELKPIGNQQFVFLMGDSRAIVQFSFKNGTKQYTYDELEHETPWLFKEFQPYEHTEEELKEFEGHYYNKDFQIGKELRLENGVLMFYKRNGAWKNEMTSLAKDLLEIPISPIKFVRNKKNEVISFSLMGIVFEKI
jgi:CubicO group peptidase (beta-lactamase class C family)